MGQYAQTTDDNADIEVHNRGGFDSVEFYNAFHKYKNQSIQESIICNDPLVRMFAILDRRIGKRTLSYVHSSAAKQPDWLRLFYLLRLNAENL